MDSLRLSTITKPELRYEAARRPQHTGLNELVEKFLDGSTVKAWNSRCARAYAGLTATQEKDGAPPSNLDTMIAAHALAHHHTVTTDDAVFRRIKDLRVEDWTKEPEHA